MPRAAPSSPRAATAALFSHLRHAGWAHDLRQLLRLGLLGLLACSLIRDTAWRHLALQGLLQLLLAAVSLKELAQAPDTWRDARLTWQRTRHPGRWFWHLFAPEIRAWVLTAGRLLWAGLRKPRAAAAAPASTAPGEQVFTTLRRSSHGSLLPLAVISSLAELPVVHLILGAQMADPRQALTLHLVLLAGNLLTLALLLGDARLIGRGEHRLDAGQLHLAVGARFDAALPRVDILEATALSPAEGRALARGPQAVVCSPAGEPNVRLRLRPGHGARVSRCGQALAGVCEIGVRVDDPAALLRALTPTGAVDPDGTPAA